MTYAEKIQIFWQRTRQSAVFYGVFATGIRVGANILLLPLLLTKLPTAELAVWWVFCALGNFANLADFGFGQVITRVYSYLWAGAEDFDAEGLRPPPQSREPNLPRIRQLSETIRSFYLYLSLGASLVLAIVGTLVLLKPSSAVVDHRLAWIAWAGYLLTVTYNLGASRWLLACQGLGKVREMQASYLWSGLAYVAAAAMLLLAGWGLMALVVANLLRAVIIREYCRIVYYVAVPKEQHIETKPDREMLRRLWPNAAKFGMILVGGFLLANGSVLISSHFLGEQITASFGLTAQIGAFLTGFASLWLSVKWPQLTMLRTQGRLEEMSVLFARRLALTMITFALLAVLVVLAGNQLLQWKGTHTRLLATPALTFYFGYLAIQLFYVQFGCLAFTENVVPFFKIAIFTGLGMLALSLFMTRTFGLWGMLVAPPIAECVYSAWFTVRRGFRGQCLRPGEFVRAAFSGQIKCV
jgi:O-antigen/teichoic acid export membrane protein